jgi:serine/threonine protein kinase
MTGLVTTGKVNPPGKFSLVGRRLGRYEVLARLASGGMAEVYIARAQGVAGFERLVALKVLHANLAHEEQFISMFLDEARLAARIRHPNVVATLDISGTEETGYFLVMEYIEGEHAGHVLSAAVKLGERIPAPVTLRIVVDALSGLGAAHGLTDENGVILNLVHRDVSPHNILVGVDGVARLTDFGVAKAEVRLSHTREGQIKGKLAYMAPEQASTGKTDCRSDLFSIGIILWETLTGNRLFRADTTASVLNKLLTDEVPLASSVSESLRHYNNLLAKALERDPDKRFQTADEFIDAIEDTASKSGDGIARRRDVGKIVEKYAFEKLSRDRARVKEAIHLIGQTPMESRPGGFRDDGTGSSVYMGDNSLSARYIPSISGVSKVATPSGVTPSNQVIQGTTQVERKGLSSIPDNEEQELSSASLDTGGMSSSMLSAIDAMSHSKQGARWLLWFAGACLLLALVAIGALLYQQQDEQSLKIREIAPVTPAKIPAKGAAQPEKTPPITNASAPAPNAQIAGSGAIAVDSTSKSPGAVKPQNNEKKPNVAHSEVKTPEKTPKTPAEKIRKKSTKQEPSPDDLLLINPYLSTH